MICTSHQTLLWYQIEENIMARAQERVASSCERGNDPSGSIECMVFLN